MCVLCSHCQRRGFTFYCIVNAGISLFIIFIITAYMYICVLVWFCGISFVFLHRCVIYESVNQHVCIF